MLAASTPGPPGGAHRRRWRRCARSSRHRPRPACAGARSSASVIGARRRRGHRVRRRRRARPAPAASLTGLGLLARRGGRDAALAGVRPLGDRPARPRRRPAVRRRRAAGPHQRGPQPAAHRGHRLRADARHAARRRHRRRRLVGQGEHRTSMFSAGNVTADYILTTDAGVPVPLGAAAAARKVDGVASVTELHGLVATVERQAGRRDRDRRPARGRAAGDDEGRARTGRPGTRLIVSQTLREGPRLDGGHDAPLRRPGRRHGRRSRTPSPASTRTTTWSGPGWSAATSTARSRRATSGRTRSRWCKAAPGTDLGALRAGLKKATERLLRRRRPQPHRVQGLRRRARSTA